MLVEIIFLRKVKTENPTGGKKPENKSQAFAIGNNVGKQKEIGKHRPFENHRPTDEGGNQFHVLILGI